MLAPLADDDAGDPILAAIRAPRELSGDELRKLATNWSADGGPAALIVAQALTETPERHSSPEKVHTAAPSGPGRSSQDGAPTSRHSAAPMRNLRPGQYPSSRQ